MAITLLALPCPAALARPLGLLTSGLGLVLAGLTLLARPWQTPAAVLSSDLPWIPSLGVSFHWQLDSLSAPLVLLTAVLSFLAQLLIPGAPRTGRRDRSLVAALLVVQSGALAAFLAADLILFFLAFEMVLIPMWLIIRYWGAPEQRIAAATRFVLYTAFGSVCLLAGILMLGTAAGTTDLGQLTAQHGQNLDYPTQVLAAALLLLGLAVKVPVWPLHTWLPAAHTAAPTVGSVLLAGVLLKLGSYGMVRLVLPIVPMGFARVAPYLAALAVISIIWGGLLCLRQQDLKSLVAYSSIAHLGFVTLGIASGTAVGLQGALFANIAHGILSALLFVVAGALKDRGLSTFAELSGLRQRAPRLGGLLAFAAIASLGLPGLAGFWGEFLVLFGAWQGRPGSGWRWQVAAGIALLGTALAAGYLLRMLRHCWHGSVPEQAAEVPPLQRREWAAALVLVVGTLVLGLVPALLLRITEPGVHFLLLSLGGAAI